MAKDPSHTKIPRLDGVTGSRIPMPGSFAATRTSSIPGASKISSKIGKPTSAQTIGLTLRQQASNLLPKNLTQVANLVRTKTANTFPNRFLPSKSKLTSNAKSTSIDTTMVQEKIIGCRPEEAQTPDTAPQSQMPIDMTATLIRSETFEMTYPTVEPNQTDCDISKQLQPIGMIQTSSPHSTVNASKRKFNFDDSANLFDTSDVLADDITKVHADQTIDLTKTLSHPSTQPPPATGSSLQARLRMKHWVDSTPKPKQNELTHVLSPLCSPIVKNNDTLIAPSPCSTTFPVNQISHQSTMIVPEAKLVDITMAAGNPNPWNVTEVLPPNNRTQLLFKNEADTTLVASQPESDPPMDVDEHDYASGSSSPILNTTITANSDRTITAETQAKANRFSFGLDLTEFNLDCSIDLCDISVASNSAGGGNGIPGIAGSPMSTATNSAPMRRQNSFEIDDSLGILTPDQMKEFLDSSNTNASNAGFLLNFQDGPTNPFRVDMTPSPEELPLDPIEIIKTEPNPLDGETHPDDNASYQHHMEELQLSQTDSDSKTDQMSKSTASKVSSSNSCFITSITSITSLDTGYQGDGEMSRPASRGAGSHSPSSVVRLVHQLNALAPIEDHHPIIVPRRTADPMTDSDFFTESDADDAVNRCGAGDRRAQIIDGHLYDGAGGEIEAGANVFIGGRQRGHIEGGESLTEDSCMESSGIFTDVENRGDEELGQLRSDGGGMDEHDELSDDMSPNGSTDTIKSNTAEYNAKNASTKGGADGVAVLMTATLENLHEERRGGHSCNTMSASTTSSINSSNGSDQMSVDDHRPDDDDKPLLNHDSAAMLLNQTIPPSGSGGSEHLDTDRAGCDIATTQRRDQPTVTPAAAPSTARSASTGKATSARKLGTAVVGIRKQNKNEANVALKRTELRRSVTTASPGGLGASRAASVARVSSAASKSKSNSTASTPAADGGDRMVENLENRRPHSASNVGSAASSGHATTGSASVSSGVATTTTTRKCTTATPNKWDAVMNKIATSKSATKTRNYSAVKSKVTCGLSKRGSPAQLRSPAAGDHPVAMETTGLTAKRLFAGSAKRTHTHSKDSSQSDLSVSGGVTTKSNGSAASTPSPESRTAKKRDVRSISISPSDLGPPPKTNGHTKTAAAATTAVATNNNNCIGLGGPNSGTTKTAALQKRFAANVAASHASTVGDPKLSPLTKKGSTKLTLSKTPLKDHNRLATITPISPTLKGSTVISTAHRPTIKSTASHAADGTVGHHPPAKTTAGSPISTHSSPSPNHTNHHHHHPSAPIGRGNGFDSTTLGKIRNSAPPAIGNEAALRAKSNGKLPNGVGSPTEGVAPSVSAAMVATVSKAVGANLGCGGGGSACGGKGVEALGVLIQYLVFNMDAFGNAHWQQTYEKTNCALLQTRVQLDNARANYQRLDEQLQQKDIAYAQREQEIQALHRAECKKAEAKEAELLARIGELSSTENELREKVQASESEFGDRLRVASQRERDLNEKLNTLSRQLVAFSKEAELKERELTEKITLYQDELAVMRKRNTSHETGSNTPQRMLHDEVESLRCVLDLKQQEISELRKQIHQLVKDNETLPAVTLKVQTLQSRLEDVQLQLKQKCNEETELRSKLKQVEQSFSHESSSRKSLSLRNEQLQWKLMQNSEKFTTTLNELSKRYTDQSDYLNTAKDSLYGQENSSQSDLSATDSTCRSRVLNTTGELFHMDDISPPSTPVVKGVVEKNESVSWVLEMNDEESAEALTSRIVRRAGSFRSNLSDKYPSQQTPAKKRQLSQGSSNPLSQSASAAAVLRQFSEDSSPKCQQKKTNGSPAIRSRSKSVSTSNNPKQTRDMNLLDSWIEPPLFSSSPRRKNGDIDTMFSEESEAERSPKITRARSNSVIEAEDAKSSVSAPHSSFRRSNSYRPSSGSSFSNRRSSLSSTGGRVEQVLHAAGASIQDSPKFQQIKESAGEAMVSGTNSEDEEGSSTGSSDESMSVSSGRTTNSSHSHFNINMASGDKMRMSLEDVMMHEIEASLSRSLDDGF